MNCEILRTLYVRANGQIPCNDDLGERQGLGWVEPGFTLRALFESEPYVHIREALKRAEPPWPDLCAQCAFLRPLQPIEDSVASRRVHKLQIEASLACGLRCPGCSQGQQFKQRTGDKVLSLTRSELLFQAFAREGFALDWIEYCGQGEPLSHPHFDAIVSLGRRDLPGTRQRLITNGNYAFRNKIKTPLDEIIVSCDGYYPESYARYRIGGSVERVLAFMADAVAESRGRTTVIWKYIVLACNDSDAELRAAGQAAIAIGVDALLFVFTHSAERSARFKSDNRHELLQLVPRAIVSTTPVQQRLDRHGLRHPPTAWGQLRENNRRYRGLLHSIDELQILAGAQIFIRGWIAWDGKAVDRLEVRYNGRPLGQALLRVNRRDVTRALPAVTDESVGFVFSAPVSPSGSDSLRIELCVTSVNGRTSRIEGDYALSCESPAAPADLKFPLLQNRSSG